MEKLKIENFGGIQEMELEIRPVTVLIGPQGAGKSIVAKLLYFFKSFVSEIQSAVEEDLGKKMLDDNQRKRFTKFFPVEAWPLGSFFISYRVNDSFISIRRESKNLLIFNYSDSYKQLFSASRKRLSVERDKQKGEPTLGLLGTGARLRRQFVLSVYSYTGY